MEKEKENSRSYVLRHKGFLSEHFEANYWEKWVKFGQGNNTVYDVRMEMGNISSSDTYPLINTESSSLSKDQALPLQLGLLSLHQSLKYITSSNSHHHCTSSKYCFLGRPYPTFPNSFPSKMFK